MKYEEFVGYVQTKIEEKLGEEVRVELHQVIKNNSVELDGLSFYGKDIHMAPTIYLNDLYAEYEDGKTMPEIVDKIVSLYQNAVTTENFRAEDYLDFEKVKEHLACKLINRKKNEKLLREVPYQDFLNLAVVAYYKVEDEIIGKATILVRKSHCKSWGVEEEEVIRCARENTQKILPVKFLGIGTMLETYGYHQEATIPMYILTNEENYFGASAMIFDSVLEKIGKALKDDFWILPSSIHECIIIPAGCAMPPDEMTDLVKEVNQKEVSVEEYLSDQIYYYQTAMHRLAGVEVCSTTEGES